MILIIAPKSKAWVPPEPHTGLFIVNKRQPRRSGLDKYYLHKQSNRLNKGRKSGIKFLVATKVLIESLLGKQAGTYFPQPRAQKSSSNHSRNWRTFLLMFNFKVNHHSALFPLRSPLLSLEAFSISQEKARRLIYFNYYAVLSRAFSRFISLKYFFLKYFRACFKGLFFLECSSQDSFSYKFFLALESWEDEVDLRAFSKTFFVYKQNWAQLNNPLILSFENFFLRLDVRSFFYWWIASENLRLVFYNNYINSSPYLRERPLLRRALVQTVNRSQRAVDRIFFSLQMQSKEATLPWVSISFREKLNYRFFMMLISRRYMIVQILWARSFSFCYKPFFHSFRYIEKNVGLSFLRALHDKGESHYYGLKNMFFCSWFGAWIFSLFYIFVMEQVSSFLRTVHRWPIPSYRDHYGSMWDKSEKVALPYHLNTVEYFSYKWFRKFQLGLFYSKPMERAFLIEDLGGYEARSRFQALNGSLSFIDRYFTYRMIIFSINTLFDWRPLRAMMEHYSHDLPGDSDWPLHQRTLRQAHLIQPKDLAAFARPLLKKFTFLPNKFVYILSALEYWYWRILSLDEEAKVLGKVLPLFYFFLRRDLDVLTADRHYSFLKQIGNSRKIPLATWETDYILPHRSLDVLREERRMDPHLVISFFILKDFFHQIVCLSMPLSTLAFFTRPKRVSQDYLRALKKNYWNRFRLFYNHTRLFRIYQIVDRTLWSHFTPKFFFEDFRREHWAHRQAWLRLLTEQERELSNEDIGPRFFCSYQWSTENRAIWHYHSLRVYLSQQRELWRSVYFAFVHLSLEQSELSSSRNGEEALALLLQSNKN